MKIKILAILFVFITLFGILYQNRQKLNIQPDSEPVKKTVENIVEEPEEVEAPESIKRKKIKKEGDVPVTRSPKVKVIGKTIEGIEIHDIERPNLDIEMPRPLPTPKVFPHEMNQGYVLESEIYGPEKTISYMSIDEDNRKLSFEFDKKNKKFRFISDTVPSYITSGVLAAGSLDDIKLELADQKVEKGNRDKLIKHNLYMFGRHLLYDTYNEDGDISSGRWFFKDKSVCPKESGKNLSYFTMSLEPASLKPNSDVKYWYIGDLRIHGSVVRDFALGGFRLGNKFEFKNVSYECKKRGVFLKLELDDTYVQLSGDRIGITRGENGVKNIVFKKQPFLAKDISGTYQGLISGHDGLIGTVTGKIANQGMSISLYSENGDHYYFRANDKDRIFYQNEKEFFRPAFKKNETKGRGVCMASYVETKDPMNSPLVYCLGNLDGDYTGTYGFLLRKDFE